MEDYFYYAQIRRFIICYLIIILAVLYFPAHLLFSVSCYIEKLITAGQANKQGHYV